jgi:predicted ArsR family transcriptional regulator
MADKISSRQQQILKLLLEHKEGLSIDEIALALSISRNAVTQHFVGLENKGYLRPCALNKTAGRPVCTYTLTDTGVNYFPKQYAWFSELILTDLKQSMGSQALISYLQKLAGTLAQDLQPQFTDKETSERLKILLNLMNNLGFQVKVSENSEDRQTIIEACNCVYHDLAQKHEEMCEFDKTLMAALLNKPIEQLSCMAKGEHVCAFKISHE